MIDFTYTLIIVLLPMAMFILLGLLGQKMKSFAGVLGTTGLGVSWILSLITAYQYFFIAGKIEGIFKPIIGFNTVWLHLTENLHIDMGILLDPISVMMLVVITTVSFMVWAMSNTFVL